MSNTATTHNATPTTDESEKYIADSMKLPKAELAQVLFVFRKRLLTFKSLTHEKATLAFSEIAQFIELNRPDKRNKSLAWPQLNEVVFHLRAGDMEAGHAAIQVAISSAEKMVMDAADDVALDVARFRPILDFATKLMDRHHPAMPPGEDILREYEVQEIAKQANRAWTNFLAPACRLIRQLEGKPEVSGLVRWANENAPGDPPGDQLENIDECDSYVWALFEQVNAMVEHARTRAEAGKNDDLFHAFGVAHDAGLVLGSARAWGEVVEAARRQRLLGKPVGHSDA